MRNRQTDNEQPKRARLITARVEDHVYQRVSQLARESSRTMSSQAGHMLKLAMEVIEANEGIDNLNIAREQAAAYRAQKGKGKT